jgi:hypothetical protein
VDEGQEVEVQVTIVPRHAHGAMASCARREAGRITRRWMPSWNSSPGNGGWSGGLR